MFPTRHEVVGRIASNEVRQAMRDIQDHLLEYECYDQLDGEGLDHQVIVHVSIPLDKLDESLVIDQLKVAGWKNPEFIGGTVRFYF